MSPWEKSFIIVTGKGGTGRTVTAATLAFAAAQSGRSACLVELSGNDRAAAIVGLAGRSFHPVNIAERLDYMSMTAAECLDDFGRRKLKIGALAGKLLSNRVTLGLVDAVPGLQDLLQLGKIDNLLNEPLADDPHYDVMVIDAPATGHGLTLLSAARAMREITARGMFHELAATIERQMQDPAKTAVVVVTLPEELPIQETVELIERLGPERDLLSAAVINQMQPPRLPESPRWSQVRVTLEQQGLSGLIALGDAEIIRSDAERRASSQLRASLPTGVPVFTIPRVDHAVRRADIEAFASALVAQARGPQ
jgi:anion-transporting  ArsA/GET3 family ATPase